MYQDLISIDSSTLDFKKIQRFISNFSRMVYSGQGSKGNLVKNLKLVESDALKVFLGIPDSYITPEFQQVMETAFAYSQGMSFGAHPEIWTKNPAWRFVNPNKSAQAGLDGVALDIDYIKSFGIRLTVWESEILHAKIQSYKDRIIRGQELTEQNFKFMMALAIFGFPDPYQFFTDIDNAV